MRIENPLRSRPLFAQGFTLRDVIELFFCLAASKYVTAPAPAVRGCLSQTICQYPSVGARQSLRTLRGVESVILLNIARFKQAVQSPPCLFGALCSALRRKTFFSSILLNYYPALRRGVPAALFRESGIRSALFRERAILHCTTLFRDQRECPCGHVPRTSFITLHGLLRGQW